MRKVLSLIILMVSVFAIVVTVGCNDKENIICGTGTIKFVTLEGGFYGIIGDNGKHYEPINLPHELQTDGLRVRFKAKIRDDIITIRMWGIPIEILEIEELERMTTSPNRAYLTTCLRYYLQMPRYAWHF